MSRSFCELSPVFHIDRIYTAFEESYDGQFRFPGESHPMWELSYILEGEAGITSAKELYVCHTGELILHPANTFHNVWALEGKPFRVLTMSFTGRNLERYVPFGKFVPNDIERTLLSLLRTELFMHFEKNAGSILPRQAENTQMLANLLEALCLSLHRHHAKSLSPTTDRRAVLFSELVSFLEREVDCALTAQQICATFGVGATTLKELFRAYTGIGVMKYYNHLRVRRATELIAQGYTMAQIATQMHFSSQNYFSAFFRRETGKTPSQYK